MQQGRRVILTRPSSDNQAWAAGLQQAGYPVQVWPLIDIATLDLNPPLSDTLAHKPPCQAIMFVSRNAVKHAMPALAGVVDWATTRCWVTGPGSRQALLAAGVPAAAIDAPHESAAQFDTEALWQVVRPGLKKDQPVLILRGSEADQSDSQMQGVGRDWLTQQLQSVGVPVLARAVYQRQCPVWHQDQCAQAALAATDGSVWVLSSSQAVAHLQKLLPAQPWAAAKALATHERIAQAAHQIGFIQIKVCKPTLSALLASLESWHEQ